MARRGSQPPAPVTNVSVPLETRRVLQRTEGNVTGLRTVAAKQQKEIDGKMGSTSTDKLALASFISQQLGSNGKSPLSISALQGRASQPQFATAPNYTTLPSTQQPGIIVSKNNQLYQFGPGGSGGVLGAWNALGGSGCLIDTHANRLANFPAGNYQPGTLFFETDRTVLYVDKAGVWNFAAGMYEDVFANRPIDLAAPDESFLFFATDTVALYAWNGGTLTWLSIVGGGGPSTLGERTITASDSIGATDYTLFCDATTASLTVTFPAAPVAGRIVNNKKIDTTAHTVTLNGNGKNIEGSASVVIAQANLSLETQYDGTGWRVI